MGETQKKVVMLKNFIFPTIRKTLVCTYSSIFCQTKTEKPVSYLTLILVM